MHIAESIYKKIVEYAIHAMQQEKSSNETYRIEQNGGESRRKEGIE